MAIETAWNEIETWLQGNAAQTFRSLPPPASSQEIFEAQKTSGLRFPPLLVASLNRHNGSGDFMFPVYNRLSSAAQIAKDYAFYLRGEVEMRRRAEEKYRTLPRQAPPLGADEFYYWNPAWVPFAFDVSGNCLFMTQVEGEDLGRIGIHDKDEGGSFSRDPLLASLSSLMEGIREGLHSESLNLWGEWCPVVEDGELEWREPTPEGPVEWDMDELSRRFGL
jgi:cell wall assembly regulator SMI1